MTIVVIAIIMISMNDIIVTISSMTIINISNMNFIHGSRLNIVVDTTNVVLMIVALLIQYVNFLDTIHDETMDVTHVGDEHADGHKSYRKVLLMLITITNMIAMVITMMTSTNRVVIKTKQIHDK